ncbi:hypothetical protein L873DRAFT_633452 [Choiromyces venosus 120613-1]|uniref:Uncharacterized protein n=1 Tax=Choiromyces venosus 120613-1 TaxID=1336337 RepID=A0A3N4JTR8_9PEZI|nr:hypothetical protein L873DRAFT_633452 [Choiromyces venosus 120613-1]
MYPRTILLSENPNSKGYSKTIEKLIHKNLHLFLVTDFSYFWAKPNHMVCLPLRVPSYSRIWWVRVTVIVEGGQKKMKPTITNNHSHYAWIYSAFFKNQCYPAILL